MSTEEQSQQANPEAGAEGKRNEEQVAKHLGQLSNWHGGRQAILDQRPAAAAVQIDAQVCTNFGAASILDIDESSASVVTPSLNSQAWDHIQAMIYKMNQTYDLPCNFTTPDLDLAPGAFYKRMGQFKQTLGKEFTELQEICDKDYVRAEDALTDLSDLLGDIIVYCLSEAARFGLPMAKILSIIMESNMSKLGADGKAIKDENDKFLKGPNYWKPEPRIRELLIKQVRESKV